MNNNLGFQYEKEHFTTMVNKNKEVWYDNMKPMNTSDIFGLSQIEEDKYVLFLEDDLTYYEQFKLNYEEITKLLKICKDIKVTKKDMKSNDSCVKIELDSIRFLSFHKVFIKDLIKVLSFKRKE